MVAVNPLDGKAAPFDTKGTSDGVFVQFRYLLGRSLGLAIVPPVFLAPASEAIAQCFCQKSYLFGVDLA